MLLHHIKMYISEVKEKLPCISFSASHPVPSRVLIIYIVIQIAC